ncbi:hypothetical protein FERRO_08080 [Ferrovum sp. JA12]|nr:hypothetical protein FERRO_08080 [Ferrovum sp. JA12]
MAKQGSRSHVFPKTACGEEESTPRCIVTDKLVGYTVTNVEVLPSVARIRNKCTSNWVANSHQPTREGKCRSRRFKSPAEAQRILPTFPVMSNPFHSSLHRLKQCITGRRWEWRFADWRDVYALEAA